ncbi:MAG TPA: hypothetical protein VGE29_15015 [Prosthecobacter sp.]
MKASPLIQFLSSVAVVTLLAACQIAPSTPTKPGAPGRPSTAKSADPAKTLAGRWHNNHDGATKQFSPAQGTLLKGDLFGFWPEGAHYTVSHVDSAKRSLKLAAISMEPQEEGNEDHHFTAEVQFTADGAHMTMTRHLPKNAPDEVVTYYRVP